MHYLLFYELVDDYLARRAALRSAHLEKAWAASARGELVLAGALADPVDRAALLFRGDSPAVAEEFARADPYVTNGLVRSWSVRPGRRWPAMPPRPPCVPKERTMDDALVNAALRARRYLDGLAHAHVGSNPTAGSHRLTRQIWFHILGIRCECAAAEARSRRLRFAVVEAPKADTGSEHCTPPRPTRNCALRDSA